MTFLTQPIKAGMVEKFRQAVRSAIFGLLFAAVPLGLGATAAEAKSSKSHSASKSGKSASGNGHSSKSSSRTARAKTSSHRTASYSRPNRSHSATFAEAGPYEALVATAAPVDNADPQFRSLFLSWKKQDSFQGGAIGQGTISVPSAKPIRTSVAFTSGFGVRADPFFHSAAMHAGIDLAGPIGTPIYATADGVVGRAEWANGYGNLVELDHGRGIATRYGHLSAILVHAGDHVKRGDVIARMGSTGRSTGSHLHYEVRLDGHAVNPVPFLQSADYLVAMQNRDGRITAPLGVGGPES